ncbi:MurR/RpiR family transcriptional regulator [Enterococcus hirae]|uniref:MurR/RpiR family transcriptional regulator n=1 Tax=Enterococcus TaxID=1350 RepID=UPI0010226DF8|nr:MurR/RpiR family transcriptional regulator [Enterococcus faecium]RYJ83678.1 MurR/RpiR family transcriptional regulator [Enterococcus faecium]
MLVREKINESPNLTELEKTIAMYILENESGLNNESARSIAQKLYVSPSTIIRFCQKIGFEGYNDFREAFLEETAYLNRHFNDIDPNRPFVKHDNNEIITKKIGALYQETIADSLSLIASIDLEKATEIIYKSENIFICSAGDTIEMGRTFRNRMIKLGRNVIVDDRLDNLFYEACNASTTDCFILISYSGETSRLLRIANKLKERKIEAIVITSYGENSLSNLFSCKLYISTRETLVDNLGNFSTLISVSFILDSLYACYFSMNYESNEQKRRNNSSEFEYKRKSQNPLIND